MANDLTTTVPTTTSPAMPWSPPRLSSQLVELVTAKAIWTGDRADLPALTAEQRADAEHALAVYAERPRGASPERIAVLVGEAALVMPMRVGSAVEERARLAIYQRQLADIDSDVLAAAFDEAQRTLKWFPTIAELRDIAGRLPARRRVVIASRLRQLLAVEAPPPAGELVPVQEVTALLDSLRPAAPARTDRLDASAADRSQPTIDDYRSLGLSEDEAAEQWGSHMTQERERREAQQRASGAARAQRQAA